ncbi:MAG: phosphate ABC transporter, permease protein PstA, partial [Lachnospiraceae bacterium]|nr:phosphate ABC transporter, permease protein PstA [Lachnospiraceae bacterium]
MKKIKSPISLIIRIIVFLATLITVGVIVTLVVYILAKGIPNLKPELFEWEYTTENASMMP